jgi:hypothetical protein
VNSHQLLSVLVEESAKGSPDKPRHGEPNGRKEHHIAAISEEQVSVTDIVFPAAIGRCRAGWIAAGDGSVVPR